MTAWFKFVLVMSALCATPTPCITDGYLLCDCSCSTSALSSCSIKINFHGAAAGSVWILLIAVARHLALTSGFSKIISYLLSKLCVHYFFSCPKHYTVANVFSVRVSESEWLVLATLACSFFYLHCGITQCLLLVICVFLFVAERSHKCVSANQFKWWSCTALFVSTNFRGFLGYFHWPWERDSRTVDCRSRCYSDDAFWLVSVCKDLIFFFRIFICSFHRSLHIWVQVIRWTWKTTKGGFVYYGFLTQHFVGYCLFFIANELQFIYQ